MNGSPAAIVALGLALALAGCTGDPDAERRAREAAGLEGGDGVGGADDGRPTDPRTIVVDFRVALPSAVLGVAQPDEEPWAIVQVPEGYGTLDATVAWSCTAPVPCELTAELRRGRQEIVDSADGPSPLRLESPVAVAGMWQLWADPSGLLELQAPLEGTFTVTLRP